MPSKTVIFAGADINDYDWLSHQVKPDCTIICADSGARHAHAINITPDIIIGDFDSITPDLLNFYEGKSRIIHDGDQNTTDLIKALGQTNLDTASIDIYGAIGQRADHDFSNYLILMGIKNPNKIILKTKNETRHIIKSSYDWVGNIGDKIGIFPMSDTENLTTSGLKYSPEVLGGPYNFGWNGACNEMSSTQASIRFDKGAILLTHSFIE